MPRLLQSAHRDVPKIDRATEVAAAVALPGDGAHRPDHATPADLDAVRVAETREMLGYYLSARAGRSGHQTMTIQYRKWDSDHCHRIGLSVDRGGANSQRGAVKCISISDNCANVGLRQARPFSPLDMALPTLVQVVGA